MLLISNRFPFKRAFVTGAGSGLGQALCLALADDGWTVGVQDIDARRAQDTLAQVVARGARGECYVFDVASPEAFLHAATRFCQLHEGVDLVINNAGVAVGGPLDEIPEADLDWILGVNLRGPLNGCRAFLPRLKEQRSGHLVNVASLAGLLASPELGAYTLTKFAVVGLSETLYTELGPHGIDVSVVCPFFFKTGILDAARGMRSPTQDLLLQKVMARSSAQASDVAIRTLEGVGARDLYILPHLEGRVGWWIKRLSPGLLFRLVSFQYGFMRAEQKSIWSLGTWLR